MIDWAQTYIVSFANAIQLDCIYEDFWFWVPLRWSIIITFLQTMRLNNLVIMGKAIYFRNFKGVTPRSDALKLRFYLEKQVLLKNA